MPARVIFDTGSEHLAVTGALCSDKTSGEYHVYNDDKFSKHMSMEIREKKPKDEEKEKTSTDGEKEDQEHQELTELVMTKEKQSENIKI